MRRVGCTVHLFELHFNIKPMKAIITHQDMSCLNEFACCVYNSGAGKIPSLSEDLEEMYLSLLYISKSNTVWGI